MEITIRNPEQHFDVIIADGGPSCWRLPLPLPARWTFKAFRRKFNNKRSPGAFAPGDRFISQ